MPAVTYTSLPVKVKAFATGGTEPVVINTQWQVVVKQACLQANVDTLCWIDGVRKHDQGNPAIVESTLRLLRTPK